MNNIRDSIERHVEISTLYELITKRIKEIEGEMLSSKSELTIRHLQKSLDHNREILKELMLVDTHSGDFH